MDDFEQQMLSAPLPSPWKEVREANPNVILVRVIDPVRRLQFWLAIERTARNLELGAELWDGATAVGLRPVDGATDTIEVIAEYDAAWHKNKNLQCLSTSPTTGSNA